MGNNETREQLADILYKQGAYCGTCDYEGRCPDCDKVLDGYAAAILEAGWQPPTAEVNLVAAVAELDAIAKDIRFWHAGELADRLDAIIARRFGYVVRHVGEETANA